MAAGVVWEGITTGVSYKRRPRRKLVNLDTTDYGILGRLSQTTFTSASITALSMGLLWKEAGRPLSDSD
ncbi:hypothetical protein BFJ67_g15518 [Fusarium oxysporum f. sp. cepae]|nr:hypothetical protein BFJ67_g15518 [Fusarium oxysporum f. sp. cepae]